MSRGVGEAAAREIVLLQWAEANPVGDLWSSDDARWATALARASSQTGSARLDFQRERARFAAKRLGERDERLAAFTRQPLWSGSWPGRALLLGLILGVGVERLGGAQMNLLALPIWVVLILQMLGYLLFVAWRGRRLPGLALWERWIAGRAGARGGERLSALAALWLKRSRPLQMARASLLWHLLLLGLSLGMIVGLYARGLQREYVIGWESTFLEARQVQNLADAVLAPASLVSGVAVPAVAPLRHRAGQPPQGPARDWLHLLAMTVLLVALPRVVLVMGSLLRAGHYARALPLPTGPGARDLRVALVDPGGLLLGGLLGESGERLASPEGDRLLLTRLERAPTPTSTPWWRTPPAPAFDAVIDAANLPPTQPGWPAQRRQLRAVRLPAPLQPAWDRLLAAWEADQAARESQAIGLMASCLDALASLRIDLAPGQEPAQALQQALEQPLAELSVQLQALYGGTGLAVALSSPTPVGQLRQPLPTAKTALLGSVAGGALAGLKADLASGGLTMGAGALAGAVIGGLGAAGLSDWLNRRLDRQTRRLSLEPADLPQLARAVLERWAAALPLTLPGGALEAAIQARQPWQLPSEAALREACAELLACAR